MQWKVQLYVHHANTLNEDLNRVHSIESLYIERRFDKDSIEKIRIEVVSRVKTEKKLAQIFNQIDLFFRY